MKDSNTRWTPKSEAELKAAVDGRLLGEGHFLDFKEQPNSNNKESARDMASFAIDGGMLIIGVSEDKDAGTFDLAPQPLKGLGEKFEQIARSVPTPSLAVLTELIPSEADPTQGYLVIHIPVSPGAPHMVEGRYWGRGDKTKHYLSDPEVARLHQLRRNVEQDALGLLAQEMAEDPIPAELRHQAHLFVVAQPVGGRDDMLDGLINGPGWRLDIAELVRGAAYPQVPDYDPAFSYANGGYRRREGIALSSRNLGEGRIFTGSPDQKLSTWEEVLELRFHEDGGMRLYYSRLSDRLDGSGQQAILDAVMVSYTRRFLALLTAVSERAGFYGNWALAVGANGLDGLSAMPTGSMSRFDTLGTYDGDTYTKGVQVTWAELTSTPAAITRKLTGRFLRAIAREERNEAYLTDPAGQAQAQPV
ncbi:hypothetical protein GCM10009555_072600 [Acrocarpospora macrocephala]|uniref:Schlafen AlbA-2 domain-containing protein n=1 Tax=Acrocarpospora macrocephala TaxID=150177 RepID=A0A5M3WHZ0_9ACTN|nr:ATP-binding protein [Acrocarpospora macrocephala]GES08594.1 hypothetical protein Amac_021900 [Acrocarpospora macrocephala]